VNFFSLILIFSSFDLIAKTEEQCSAYVKLAALDTAKEILGEDIEGSNSKIGSLPISIDVGLPILRDKANNPVDVFETYQVPLTINFNGVHEKQSVRYFFNKNCYRMISAEIKAGKEIEKKLKKY
jgi:hypothetical protein